MHVKLLVEIRVELRVQIPVELWVRVAALSSPMELNRVVSTVAGFHDLILENGNVHWL